MPCFPFPAKTPLIIAVPTIVRPIFDFENLVTQLLSVKYKKNEKLR